MDISKRFHLLMLLLGLLAMGRRNFFVNATGLIVHIDHIPVDRERKALRLLSYCLGCEQPDDEGSIVYALAPKHGLPEYRVTGDSLFFLGLNLC